MEGEPRNVWDVDKDKEKIKEAEEVFAKINELIFQLDGIKSYIHKGNIVAEIALPQTMKAIEDCIKILSDFPKK